MKKIFSAIIIAAIVTNVTQAQNTSTAIASIENQQILAFQKPPLSGIIKNTGAVKTVNPKAEKEFSKFCKNAKDAYWQKITDGSTVAFYKTEEKRGRRYYDEKGRFICNIFSYGEVFLPDDIRALVKSTYYMDYHIISAEEIETSAKKTYFVFIENKINFKKLKVCDGEIEVVLECFN